MRHLAVSRTSVALVALMMASAVLAAPSGADAQRRRRRRASTAPAHIIISTSVEGAEVLIDEVSVGFTPLEPVEVEAGSHTVRVRRPGYTEFTDVLEIRPGQDAEVPVDMIPLAMVVTVRSTPDEARVFVDGTFRGSTPIELELIEGDHELRVTAPRFRESVRTLTAIAGTTDLVDVTLEAIPERLLTAGPTEWYEEPLTWILVGSGAAVIAAVIITLVVVLGQSTQLQEFCGDNAVDCDPVVMPGWTF